MTIATIRSFGQVFEGPQSPERQSSSLTRRLPMGLSATTRVCTHIER